MANWDHKTNIGTHPVLDPDPEIRLNAIIAAADAQIARLTAARTAAVDALTTHRVYNREV